MEAGIAARIECIVQTFKTARELAEKNGLSAALQNHLFTTGEYYRSVAFEGAAMGLALSDVTVWKEFLANQGSNHAVQVHIGLGWALAERQEPVPTVADWPEPDAVLDGYGYYHGLFRRRLSIRTQSIPEGLTDAQLPAFDRGLGRSIWYISKGDLEVMNRMTDAFAQKRQPDLWRGIGIAVAFVGGCNDLLLGQVASASSTYRPQLLEGAQRALRSRTKAGTPTADAERAVRQWTQAL
jgi:enediyne biosynthesis protein E3